MSPRPSLPLSFGALVLLTLLPACGSSDPYCGNLDDLTGRAIAFCPSGRQDPVCDLPGEEARYEDGAMGFVLVGGVRASCDEERQIVCPMGTEGDAYCITDPEL